MQVFMITAGVLILGMLSWAISKTKHPIFTAIKTSISGVACLLLVNLVSGATGCYIVINTYSTFVATVLSVPGVVAMLMMKVVFNY